MNNLKKKAHLKNKFQNIEIKLDDAQLGFEIPPAIIMEMKSSPKKKQDVPVLYLYGNLLSRGLRILAEMTAGGLKILFSSILVPFAKEAKKTVMYTSVKINQARAESEIKLTDYISKVEADLEGKKEEVQKMNEQLNNEVENYKNELAAVFSSIENEVTVNCDKNEFQKTKPSLEYDISLFEMMARKLSESKMITNVSKVIFKVNINEKNVSNTIELDLKISGEKWSKLFSKHISSEVLKGIENYKGTVKNSHVQTFFPLRDKFVFQFSHQRLDLFVDVAKSDKNPVKVKHPQISSLLDV